MPTIGAHHDDANAVPLHLHQGRSMSQCHDSDNSSSTNVHWSHSGVAIQQISIPIGLDRKNSPSYVLDCEQGSPWPLWCHCILRPSSVPQGLKVLAKQSKAIGDSCLFGLHAVPVHFLCVIGTFYHFTQAFFFASQGIDMSFV